jgi:pilus assembly protein FimV
LIDKSHRWQKTAAAAAAFALLSLIQTSAWSLSLGRISVLSSLGEPLRAEIDIPEINAEEAASLRAEVASAAAFSAAGLEYNAAIAGLQTTLQRRADGRAYLRLTGEKSINEPFVDMILEASWSSGRIVRDYTMLFDPPLARSTQAISPTLAQSAGATSLPPQTSLPPRTAPAQGKTAGAVVQTPATAQPPAPIKTGPAKVDSATTEQITVKSGDTASKIAAQNLSNGLSLDQMLVAMMRTNPDAFINGNLNRVKSGAVLSMPSVELAQSIAPREASQMVIAQSKDFNDFRRNLATNAPLANVAPADRKAGGSIDAKVEEKKSAAPAPDKLTLSKGSIQSKADEANLAKERAEKDAAVRATEIAKNIADLAKLNAASAPKATLPAVAAPALASSDVNAAALSPIAVAPIAVAPVAMASAAPASAPAPTPVAAASAAQKSIVATPVPQETPGLLDELLGDPLVPAAAGGLVVLLGGFAFWRIRQRNKNSAHIDSSFLESRLQPDSFFGSSGGQRVDTSSDPRGNTSSIAYTSSQLDAADDVDPVAEADVYLAYGRDLQAEEILKEALRSNPGRIAIHVKLLEIYAKRRDVGSFKVIAQQAFKLTGVDSSDWVSICELGLSIDPENALYQPGVASLSGFGPPTATPAINEASSGFGSTIALSSNPELNLEPAGLDLDLDLDFSADDEPAVPAQPQSAAASNSIDFDLSGPSELSDAAVPLPEFDITSTMSMAASSAAPTARSEPGLIDFDMGDLSLDLDSSADEIATGAPSAFSEDPLETKLALAYEFVAIGDEDGARALIEEVLSEATGEIRSKAQEALANLS